MIRIGAFKSHFKAIGVFAFSLLIGISVFSSLQNNDFKVSKADSYLYYPEASYLFNSYEPMSQDQTGSHPLVGCGLGASYSLMSDNTPACNFGTDGATGYFREETNPVMGAGIIKNGGSVCFDLQYNSGLLEGATCPIALSYTAALISLFTQMTLKEWTTLTMVGSN